MNINMGVLLQKQGQYQKAEEFLLRATKMELTNKDDQFAAVFNLGLNHVHLGKLDESIVQFNKCLGMVADQSSLNNEQRGHKLQVHLNLVLVLERQSKIKEAKEQIKYCLQLDSQNTIVLKLQKKLGEASDEKQAPPSLKKPSENSKNLKGISNNQPNAESLDNTHSRKSSGVVRDIISAKSSRSKQQIAKILSNDQILKDENEDEEDQQLAKMQIVVDLAPVELTPEEENHFNQDVKVKEKQRESDLSPNGRVVRQSKQTQGSAAANPDWKNWSIEECEQNLSGPQKDQARFRMAEIYQDNLEFDGAVSNYEKLLGSKIIFQKEKTYMRLAECCYRINAIEKGFKFLNLLEKELLPTKVYTTYLLKGKFDDLQKSFGSATDNFKQALSLYENEFKDKIDKNVIGNIQFRLGWAYIRSRKDIEAGIANLKKANDNLVDNFDIKIKLA